MESQEKKHVQKGRDKAISFNFAIIFLLVDTWFDFPIRKMSCLFLLDSKPTRDVATVAWAVC